MQRDALVQIDQVRQQDARWALVLSATGTGKTYLAAFDGCQFKPQRFLFIVHREQILKDAMASFKKVIGGPDHNYGILSGNQKDSQASYLFATV